MLKINHLHAWYGQSHVLHGVSLNVGPGEIVTLLGRNGSGRSTTAKAIMGLVPAQGSITWHGQEVMGKKTFEMAQLGLGYVPESRDIFTGLTVEQNLILGQKNNRGRWSMDDMFAMFPLLKDRRHTDAGVLSGGEQQILALCRTLMGDPGLIIMDEPTEGLAPQMIGLVRQYLQQLRVCGISVLLIEQKMTMAAQISDRFAVIGHGSIVFTGTPDDLCHHSHIQKEWLEV